MSLEVLVITIAIVIIAIVTIIINIVTLRTFQPHLCHIPDMSRTLVGAFMGVGGLKC